MVAFILIFVRVGALPAFAADAISGETSANRIAAKPAKTPKTLEELLTLQPQELENIDVGLINILCAQGLQGAEDLDAQKCLDALDGWAKRVEFETERHYYRFVQHPELFRKSLAYYRMQMLGDVLVNDLRMRYNPERAQQSVKGINSRQDQDAFFANSKDIFLHGLVDGQRYGTCASMPFLYVAVARRLGYPVNLAATDEHLYVRYEEENGEHLNVEATAVSRFKTPPDRYYKEDWERPVSTEAANAGGWLRPLSNKEILGHSLFTRAGCLRSMKRHDETAKTLEVAARYLPETRQWKDTIKELQRRASAESRLDRWNALWAEIEQMHIPPGPGYVYFRDKKIRLHLFMNNGPSVAAIETAVDDFKKELGEYIKPMIEAERGIPAKPPEKEQKITVVCFKFRGSGKEVCVPEDLLPPTARGGIAAPLVDFILDNKLESQDAILAYLWNRYEEATLRKQQTVHAKMDALMADVPQPILIAREQVPMEYWNGIPRDLEVRLAGLHDSQDIVGEITAFHSQKQAQRSQDQQSQRNMARNRAMEMMRRAGISTEEFMAAERRRNSLARRRSDEARSAYPPTLPLTAHEVPEMYRDWITPDIARRLNFNDLWTLQQEEKHRQSAKEMEEWQHEMAEANKPKIQLPFRLVPGALLNGQSAEPASIPKLITEPQPETLQRTTIGKGNQ